MRAVKRPDGPPTSPPRAAEWLLKRCLPVWAREQVLGDLAEEYGGEALPSLGGWGASLWYWKQALCLAGMYLLEARRRESPARGDGMIRTTLQDLRYSFRIHLQKPNFTLAALLVLAVGIGANTAIFSVVNGTLLRPLPFPHAERLTLVWGESPRSDWTELPLSMPNFVDLRAQTRGFEQMAAWTIDWLNLSGTGEPEQVQVALVSASLFGVLGTPPILGRGFLPAEDAPGTAPVVVLSHGLWQRRFGGARDLVGRSVTLDGKPHEVVGILPAGFRFAGFTRETEVWLPFGLDPFEGRKFARGAESLGVIGLRREDVSLEHLQSEMGTIARQLAQQHPDVNADLKLNVVPLQEQAVKSVRPALLVLLGAVGLVMLIACANVANLLLARASGRRREMAVRAALGAGRLRLIRQLLTESLCLAFAGGLLGLGVAHWGIDLLAALNSPPASLFVPVRVASEQIGLDWPVVGFALAVSTATGLLFGLVPALQSSRTELSEALKGAVTAGGGLRRSRTGSLLVVAEVALSCTLLVGAGLLMKSFVRLVRVEPGFQPQSVLTMSLSLPESKYPQDSQAAALFRQLLERVQALPGVHSAGAVTVLPLSGLDGSTGFYLEGQAPARGADLPHTHHRWVSADYFRALGVGLLRGRSFTDRDDAAAPRVAIVNETMARRVWPGADPLGKRVALDFEAMRFHRDRPPDLDIPAGLREVVGIVADVKHGGLDSEPKPEMYVPYLQHVSRDLTLVVRTSGEPIGMTAAIRRELAALDPDQPVSDVRTMEQLVDESVARPRFNAKLLGVFAALAVVLAAVGLFGVVSYTVSQRTHEIGVRMALGAQARDVLGLVIGQGLKLTLAGVALGLAGATAVTRVLAGLLFEVSPLDLQVYVLVALLLGIVALTATAVPARRAMRVDPSEALRHE